MLHLFYCSRSKSNGLIVIDANIHDIKDSSDTLHSISQTDIGSNLSLALAFIESSREVSYLSLEENSSES